MAEWSLSLWENAAVLPRRDPFGKNRWGFFKAKCKIWHIDKLYFTYILKSEKTGNHYYGHSSNLEKRLKDHNDGKVRSTKAHRPWSVIYYEKFETKSEAMQREYFFKSIDGYKYLKSNQIIWYGYLTGGMAEWSNAAVLKTVEASRSPGVRIPLPPLLKPQHYRWGFFVKYWDVWHVAAYHLTQARTEWPTAF